MRRGRHAWVPIETFALEDGAFRVACALLAHANDEGVCFPSQETLADLSQRSVRTVRRHLDAFEAKGWLRVERRQRAASKYTLLSGHLVSAQEFLDRTPMRFDRTLSCPSRPDTAKAEEHLREHLYFNTGFKNDEMSEAKKEEVEAAFKAGLCTTCLKGKPRAGRFECDDCDRPTPLIGAEAVKNAARLREVAARREAPAE